MTRHESTDIAILGSGFAGSLLALILRVAGRRVVLLERSTHPRFAIGESSTPLANLKLAALAERYHLPALQPLCKYGPWKRTYPNIACGLKRGFSFFRHQRGGPFEPRADHANELLVAANPDAEHGDTHWYRPEFDLFLLEQARAAGAVYVDRCRLTDIHRDAPWHLRADTPDGPLKVTAPFVVDATGPAAPLAPIVNARDLTAGVRTRTGALYAHFRDVAPFADVLAERHHPLADHPFPCDAAALHHVIDAGWMWVLRFDNGLTSAGFSLDPRVNDLTGARAPADQFAALVCAYPSIARQFRDAVAVTPVVRVERLQRRLAPAAGDDYCMLPHTAGFIDPWLSTGIAWTLDGIEQLAAILTDHFDARERAARLAAYDRAFGAVYDLVDSLAAACMATLDRFDVLTSLTMAYFAAAITGEERIRAGAAAPAFLLADDPSFLTIAAELSAAAVSTPPDQAPAFTRRTADLLAPYNSADLCNPARRNMYPFTGTV